LLIGSDGGVFAFGDATFAGSCYQVSGGCDAPVATAIEDSTGLGYWFLTSIGTSYNFGDAAPQCFVPSQTIPLTSASTADGTTYAFLFANGYRIGCLLLFNFGDALGQLASGDRATAIVQAADQNYWIITARGAVFAFGGSIGDYGSMTGHSLNAPIVGAAGW
jgi:hypothetical protein